MTNLSASHSTTYTAFRICNDITLSFHRTKIVSKVLTFSGTKRIGLETDLPHMTSFNNFQIEQSHQRKVTNLRNARINDDCILNCIVICMHSKCCGCVHVHRQIIVYQVKTINSIGLQFCSNSFENTFFLKKGITTKHEFFGTNFCFKRKYSLHSNYTERDGEKDTVKLIASFQPNRIKS